MRQWMNFPETKYHEDADRMERELEQKIQS